MSKMSFDSKILVTGSAGVLGRALVTLLKEKGFRKVFSPSSQECNLLSKNQTEEYFLNVDPDFVFHLAGKVYGLGGNSKYKADVIYENIMINTNVIHASHLVNVNKIVAMGTVAMYPDPPVSNPALETDLWQGYPHKSEESYAVAKLAMLSMLEAYKESYQLDYAFPLSTNLYGPGDRFNDETGHVIPSLIKKFYDAKQSDGSVTVWGTGKAERDFLFSADAADGLICIMENLSGCVNLASGNVVKIKDLVNTLIEITGVSNVRWDESKPDGQLIRSYNIDKLSNCHFLSKHNLYEGLEKTWDWYVNNSDTVRT
ncbi:NAD-dependent epimerase/dehydratase family protein [Aestuariicella sp. G3-2]|uniref:NAD-dependent epimerase/dehydratase family protein n=1 Tax=Pseudomaricurvus albidus TaxID=2842452 RepID=UPI001C0AD054|nr:NAD-dependent epimerase/dehydratase family protein [Aestuariicella albida]MBU3071659.1 NAD-dependent epimerase/dehydratase family protein [Aestuariicella albida]